MSLSAPNRWAVLGLVCVAQFMVILDATIVNVSLPTIEHALHFSPTASSGSSTPTPSSSAGSSCSAAAQPTCSARSGSSSRARHLHRRLARERRRDLVRHARRRPRPAGPRRRTRLAGRARDRHPHVLGGRRAHEGARRLERDRGGGGARPAARRRAHRDALVALGLLHQPADRHRRRAARAARITTSRRGEARDERRRRRGHRHRRSARARLRDREGQPYGWGSGKTIGLFPVAIALLVAFVVIELRSKAPLIRLGIFRIRSLTARTRRCCSSRRGSSRCSSSRRSTCSSCAATARSRQASRSCRSRSGS